MSIPHTPEIDQLFEAFLSLKNTDECRAFFHDLTTVKEREAMAQRLLVAKLLSDGYNYQEVIAKTGASSATISRVARCLSYGNDGYKTCLSRLGNRTPGDISSKETKQ